MAFSSIINTCILFLISSCYFIEESAVGGGKLLPPDTLTGLIHKKKNATTETTFYLSTKLINLWGTGKDSSKYVEEKGAP